MNSDLIISQADRRPMYLQIMEQIKQRIAIGDWEAGEKLPSIRELAVTLRVSVITIKRAYLELEREGVIVTRHGRGSFVAVDGADLGTRLHEKKLDDHLEEAVKLAKLLRLSDAELQERLQKINDKINSESS